MRSIRWKIVLLCSAVILLPILFLNYYSIHTFDKFASRDLEEHMIDSAFIVGEQYKAMLDSDGAIGDTRRTQLADLAESYGREIQARIQILSSNGIVIADSATNSSLTADLSSLPEVHSALAGKYRARWALTANKDYVFYYVAYPVMKDGTLLGVAYISRHTSKIVKTITRMIRVQRITAGVAILIGALLAAFFAHSMTSRLRKLTGAAASFARGDTAFDVSVRGRDEIAELADAIRRMAADVQRTNQYNREFISTVMHELKMPVTAIKGAAELLEHGAFEKPDARDKFLGNIRFEADRLARLIWELNELTKLDTGKLHVQKEKLDYCECIRGIVERFKMTLDPPHAAIATLTPDRRVSAMVNSSHIEQVVGNVLDNAIRYTPPSGSIEVKIEENTDGTIATSVRDTGCGILPSNLARIFDRFFTTEPKDKPKDYGSGLGLAIAKSIVENHGGRIWAEGEPGKGTAIFFTLPPAP